VRERRTTAGESVTLALLVPPRAFLFVERGKKNSCTIQHNFPDSLLPPPSDAPLFPSHPTRIIIHEHGNDDDRRRLMRRSEAALASVKQNGGLG
jgi:hypothetical protein